MPKKSAIKTSLFAAAEEREQKLDRKGDLLSTLGQHVNFVALAAEIDQIAPRPSDKRGGRPPYPTELMVRVLVLQHLYNLAGEALEYQLLDRLSFQRFCDLWIFMKPNFHLPMVYHGYKLSISADQKYKLIRKRHISTAKEHDTNHFEAVLDRANTSRDVWADKGYEDQSREQRLNQSSWRLHIQHKAKKGKQQSDCQKRRNTRIARPRARVEYVFGSICAMGGKELYPFDREISEKTAKMRKNNLIVAWCAKN